MTSSNKAIEVTNLTKYYGSIKGIENVNFSVNKNEIHGFLGPNGAGKTTTIRILVGLLKQTGGSSSIFGYESGTIEAKEAIGYLPSDYELYKHYTVGEYLRYVAKLRGGAPLLDDLVSEFDVDMSRKTKELSRGNRQKVSIIQALMHDPELIIADEPTSGLDPLMQAAFDKTIRSLVKRGKTIFISSHILTEVQNICDKVTVIKEGEIVTSGEVEELLKQVPKKAIIKRSNGQSLDELATTLDAKLEQSSNGKIIAFFNYSNKEFAQRISTLDYIEDFVIPEPNLEEYFLPLYEKKE